MDHLEILLSQASPYKRKLVVTDSLFSMDGRTFSLRQLNIRSWKICLNFPFVNLSL